MFLDFDGTLVDIAQTPESVVVPQGLVSLLIRVEAALDGALAIVSGRDLADVTAYLKPLVPSVAGTHGTERRRSDGTLDVPGPDVVAEAAEMAADVIAAVVDIPGVRVEAKPYSVGLHFRAVPERQDSCMEILDRLIRGRRNAWEIVYGKLIAEARPAGFSKAGAVRAFMRETPFSGRIPVFIGDDITDEDGMKAAMELGGFAIKVGMGDSIARYRLADPQEVRRYLSSVM